MEELAKLFDEIITFEEEVANSKVGLITYPDGEKARKVFYEYAEWRFKQIELDSVESWIASKHQTQNLDLCA